MKRIVIAGAGFAGLWAARTLARRPAGIEVTLIDPKPAFDLLPMLPDVAGGRVPAAAIRTEIAPLARRWGADFLCERVNAVDAKSRRVLTGSGEVPCDALIVAAGSETNFYGNASAERLSLKLDDSRDAEALADALAERTWGACVVVGGGYTGVETATNIRRRLQALGRAAPVILVEVSETILRPSPPWMRSYAAENLARMDIRCTIRDSIASIEEGGRVRLAGGGRFDDALVVWSAGVRTPAFVREMDVEKTGQGRLRVDRFMAVAPGVFAAGDSASFQAGERDLRMSVQFAITEGACAARNALAWVRGAAVREFRPWDPGYVIPMANGLACGQALGVALRGRLPMLLHYAMGLYRTPSARQRLRLLAELARPT